MAGDGPVLAAGPAVKPDRAPSKPKAKGGGRRDALAPAVSAGATVNVRALWNEIATPTSQVDLIQAETAKAYAEEAVATRVRALDYAFASKDPAQHAYGAGLLGGIPDETLLAVQHRWRATHDKHLYAYLFQRSGEGLTEGLAHALVLLRQAFARHPPTRTALLGVYGETKQVQAYVWQVRAYFDASANQRGGWAANHLDRATLIANATANEHEAWGLGALRDQTPEVLKLITDEFFGLYKVKLIDWILAEVPRTDASVRAIAILRDGDDRGDHVDLAATLIPPRNTNQEIPLRHLRGDLASRHRLAKAFHATFHDVGPRPGGAEPDTLIGYIDLKLGHSANWAEKLTREVYSCHEALILLHHDPTDAEKLYLAVSRWWDTKNDRAVGLAKGLHERGASWNQLTSDWRTFVQTPLPGASSPFTRLSLTDHIRSVYSWTPTRTRDLLLALLNDLEFDGREAPATAAPAGWGFERQQHDLALARVEDRKLRAAHTTLAHSQGRWTPDDPAILDALEQIAETHRERVDRLRRGAEAARADKGLTAAERQSIAGTYDAQADAAESAGRHERQRLTEKIDSRFELHRSPLRKLAYAFDEDIKLSETRKLAAVLRLGEAPTEADKVYAAVMARDDDLLQIIGRLWASGEVDRLHAEAKRPALDAFGTERRPAFNPAVLFRDSADPLTAKRANALTQVNANDVDRGVARILTETEQGSADANLGPIADLFELLRGNRAPLRAAVAKAYVEFQIRAGLLRRSEVDDPVEHFLSDMSRRFEGHANNWLRLKMALAPPGSAVERAQFARERRAVGSRGVLSGVTRAATDIVDDTVGDRLGEAAARSQDRLEFFANAADEQLKPYLAASGVANREALSARELAVFEERQAERAGLENTCAQLIAGFLEVLVEAGLSPLTGGAGFLAVVDAVAASIVSMLASEALLGPNYQLLTWENAGKLVQDGFGTFLVECDVRSPIVKGLPLKFLGKHETVRQTVQNVVTGAVEGISSSVIDAAFVGVVQQKWPSSADVARHVDLLFGRLAAKVVGTQGTVRYHPGMYLPYIPFAERLKTNILFKLSLKLSEGGAKELVSIALSSAHDRTFADQVLQFLWKEARGVASATTKGATSAVGGHGTDQHQKLLITAMRRENPAAFPILLRDVIRARYNKSEELQAEHANLRAGASLSIDQFMLWKLGGQNKTGAEGTLKLRSKIHDDLLEFAELYSSQKRRVGILGSGRAATPIGDIVAEDFPAPFSPARPGARPIPAGTRPALPGLIAAKRGQPGAEAAPADESRVRPVARAKPAADPRATLAHLSDVSSILTRQLLEHGEDPEVRAQLESVRAAMARLTAKPPPEARITAAPGAAPLPDGYRNPVAFLADVHASTTDAGSATAARQALAAKGIDLNGLNSVRRHLLESLKTASDPHRLDQQLAVLDTAITRLTGERPREPE